jgi:hypothetical protein
VPPRRKSVSLSASKARSSRALSRCDSVDVESKLLCCPEFTQESVALSLERVQLPAKLTNSRTADLPKHRRALNRRQVAVSRRRNRTPETGAFRRELHGAAGLPRSSVCRTWQVRQEHAFRVCPDAHPKLAAPAQSIDATRGRGLDSLVGCPTGTVRLAAPPGPADCVPRRRPPPTNSQAQ